MYNYPTKEEILAKPPKFREGVIEATMLWKKSYLKGWKSEPKTERIKKLNMLIDVISALHTKEIPKVQMYLEYCYDPKTHTIYLELDRPSILSTLHELAHYLFDADEYKACIWSVWLFKECFPGLYKKLKWKGHLLVKK